MEARLIAISLIALACGGCETLYPRLVDRQPDASLLLECRAPPLPPDKPTYNDAVVGWMDAAQAFLDCRDEKRALVTFVKGK